MTSSDPPPPTKILALALAAMQSCEAGIMLGYASAFGDEVGSLVMTDGTVCDVLALGADGFRRTGSSSRRDLDLRLERLREAGFWEQDDIVVLDVADGGVLYVVAKEPQRKLRALTLVNAHHSKSPSDRRFAEAISALFA